MDAIEGILTRRSVRTYTNDKIPDDLIKQLLEAGFSAPSAGNEQPWHFVLIDDKDILNEISEKHTNAWMLKDAQIAILICGDLSLETHKGLWVQDCSASTQNILLAARALGLGGCWVCVYPREQRMKTLKDLLKTPENVIPFALISLGFTKDKQTKKKRYNNSRVHHNKW
jgi:nitroreductase